jgi:hypothetical protein
MVFVTRYDNDITSPRYGQPSEYMIRFANIQPGAALGSPGGETFGTMGTSVMNFIDQKVHWQRIQHIADNRRSSEIFGDPAQMPVFNWLLDLRKTIGGACEMFWKGAFPGYAFETLPQFVNQAELDDDSLQSQFQQYSSGLRRYLALVGMRARSLAPQVADPTAHVNSLINLICATIEVPVRIFLGSEAAHLASTQDSGTWNKRVARRQGQYLDPLLLRPMIKRLVEIGCISRPQNKRFKINWIDLNSMTDKDKADVFLKKAQALLQYATSGAETMLPVEKFLILVMGLELDQVKMIMDEIKATDRTLYTKLVWQQQPKGAAGEAGRPAGQTTSA